MTKFICKQQGSRNYRINHQITSKHNLLGIHSILYREDQLTENRSLGYLSSRRHKHFAFLHEDIKIQNGFTPAYLKSPVHSPLIFLVPEVKMTFRVSNAEQTRTYTVLILILLNFGMKQALPSSRTALVFKSNTLKFIRPEKKNVFNIHDPKGMKRLFQLPVGLSPLRHNTRHNYKDTLSDICLLRLLNIF